MSQDSNASSAGGKEAEAKAVAALPVISILNVDATEDKNSETEWNPLRRSMVVFRPVWIAPIVAQWLKGGLNYFRVEGHKFCFDYDHPLMEHTDEDDAFKNVDVHTFKYSAQHCDELGSTIDNRYFRFIVNRVYEEAFEYLGDVRSRDMERLEFTRLLVLNPTYTSDYIATFMGSFMYLYDMLLRGLETVKFPPSDDVDVESASVIDHYTQMFYKEVIGNMSYYYYDACLNGSSHDFKECLESRPPLALVASQNKEKQQELRKRLREEEGEGTASAKKTRKEENAA